MTTTLDPSGRTSAANSAVQRGPRELRRFRPDVEGLRAVAVVIVVLSHLSFGLPGGYVGVDVFFVISGFLITRQLVNEYDSTGKISFGVLRAAGQAHPAGRDRRHHRHSSGLQGVGFAVAGAHRRARRLVLRVLRASTGGWPRTARTTSRSARTPSPFQHYWSLSVEEQFYFVWPALIMVVGLAVRPAVRQAGIADLDAARR